MPHTKGTLFVISCLFLVLSSCRQEDEIEMEPIDELSNNCIWDKAPHCAFTDLISYNNRIYCCFREGLGHLSTGKKDLGIIRILESIDGKSWKNIGIISDPDFDLRDPKLSLTPDGKLMLIYGRYSASPESKHIWTGAKFISDNELGDGELSLDNRYELSIEGDRKLSNYWIWRIKWIGNFAYGVAYKNGQFPILVRSSDGINYSVVSELEVLGNEADIEMLPDGHMLMVIRAQSGNGFTGISSPPFDLWIWKESTHPIHCPSIITIDGVTYVAGRGTEGTTLFSYNDKLGLCPIIIIPQQGDFAYPGLEYVNGQLWMSFYGIIRKQCAIFLSRYDLPLSI